MGVIENVGRDDRGKLLVHLDEPEPISVARVPHTVQVLTEGVLAEISANREVPTESFALTMPGSVGNTHGVLVTDAEGVVENLQPAPTRNPATLLPTGVCNMLDVVLPFSDGDEHEVARGAGRNWLRKRHPIPGLRTEGIVSEFGDQTEAGDLFTRGELKDFAELWKRTTNLRCLCHDNLLKMRGSLNEFQFAEHMRCPLS